MIEVNSENWDEEVVGSEKPVLVNFWAKWSPSCKKIDAYLEEFSREYDDKLKFTRLNVDENIVLRVKNRVMVTPTIIIFYKGIPVRGIPGPAPKHIIKRKIEKGIRAVEAWKKKH